MDLLSILLVVVIIGGAVIIFKFVHGLAQVISSVLVFLIILIGIMSVFVYLDTQQFQQNFPRASTLTLLEIDGKINAGIARKLGQDERILSQDEIDEIDRAYQAKDYNAMVKEYAVAQVVHQEIVSVLSGSMEIKDGAGKSIQLDKTMLKNIMSAADPLPLLDQVTRSRSTTLETFGSSPQAIKTQLFIQILKKLNAGDMIKAYKQGMIEIYPFRLTFAVMQIGR
ncbi:hypothetical protein HZB02_00185 [Candidatus Woesearchaeota archaeon]|nr:hypothetical protein [Candidatus Woesearchaeota archaeon]